MRRIVIVMILSFGLSCLGDGQILRMSGAEYDQKEVEIGQISSNRIVLITAESCPSCPSAILLLEEAVTNGPLGKFDLYEVMIDPPRFWVSEVFRTHTVLGSKKFSGIPSAVFYENGLRMKLLHGRNELKKEIYDASIPLRR